jgi:hypothetical protein
VDENRQNPADGSRVDNAHVRDDDAFFAEPLHSSMTRSGRQVNCGRQLFQTQPIGTLQYGENLGVGGIKLHDIFHF